MAKSRTQVPSQSEGVQMSELKVYHCNEWHNEYTEFYMKSEVDKVIAHNKYKRCLAMARWCYSTSLWCYQAANTLPAGFHATLHGNPVMIEPERLFNRSALLTKWNTRWLELAEKFKEDAK